MSPQMTIVAHSLMAAVFFFVVQYYFQRETLGVSLVWAAAAAAGAAALAYAQSRRGQ